MTINEKLHTAVQELPPKLLVNPTLIIYMSARTMIEMVKEEAASLRYATSHLFPLWQIPSLYGIPVHRMDSLKHPVITWAGGPLYEVEV